jgi:hypothetical protein
MEAKNITRTTGVIALWETSNDFVLQGVEDAFASIGHGAKAPNPRTPLAALKAAMGTMTGKATGRRIAPMGTGYALLVEHVDDVAKTVETSQGLTVWLEKSPITTATVLNSNDPAALPEVQTAWNAAKAEVDGAAVSACLVEACAALGGIPLRTSGGVYWLPASAADDWRRLAAGIEAASASRTARCYAVTTGGDPESVRAIAESFVREADALVAEAGAELDAGGVSGRVATARAARLADLVAQAANYEKNLATSLAEVRARIEATQDRFATSALLSFDLV